MANKRIKDLATTATTTASDDFMAVDGVTNGTRKLSAATPAFLTSVTTPSLTSPASTNLTLAGGAGNSSVILTASGTGGVGIGTTNPAAFTGKLVIQQTTAASDALSLWNSNASGTRNLLGFAVGAGGANLGAIQTDGTNLSIMPTSNVGIGTATITSGAKLEVSGTTSASSSITGTLVVGNLTPATTVGIGGGNINAGGNLTVGGSSITLSGSTPVIDMGAKASANNPIIDFNSSGNSNDFDVRLAAKGGTSPSGTGTLTIHGTLAATASNVGAFLVGDSGTGTPTAATSVAIGGGNINAGGTGTFGGAVNITGSAFSSGGSGAPSSASSGIQLGNTASGATTIVMVNSAGAANSKIVDLNWTGTAFQGRFINDAYSAATNWLAVTGNSSAVTSVAFPSTTGNVTIASTTAGSSGAGALVVAGGLSAAGASYFGGNVQIKPVGGGLATATPFALSLGGEYFNSATPTAAAVKLRVYDNGAGSYNGLGNDNTGLFSWSVGPSNFWVNNGTLALTLASTGAATFAGAVTTGGNLTLPAASAGYRLIVTGTNNTGTGQLVIQAGGGSAEWGGTLNLFETAHATKGGYVGVGLGVSGAKFTVNSSGFSDSGEVASIDRSGNATFAGAVTSTGGLVANSFIQALGSSYMNMVGGDHYRFYNNSDSATYTFDVGSSAGYVTSLILGARSAGVGTDAITLKVRSATVATFNSTAATFAGTVIAPAATASLAPLRIPHGTAPTSPTDGDMWTTTAGLFIRINGVTKTVTLT